MSSDTATLSIGVIASASQTVEEPFAGGMESHTATLARELRNRGHRVAIHAAGGMEDGGAPVADHRAGLALSEAARGDVSMPAEGFMREHHAYLSLMLGLDARGYDVVHNNCLHYLPVAMAGAVRTPIVTTLHSPPTPWLESAIGCRESGHSPRWVSVSEANANAWRHLCDPCEVIHNGVDTDAWTYNPGPRNGRAVWSGRIVPEKAPHLAIATALRAGVPLDLAGPVGDAAYFDAEISPLLTDDEGSVVYHGHLDSSRLAGLIGCASVALVTPAWEEPFGLVAIEALSCGTPVAAFSRGAMPEVLDERTGVLAAPGDVDGLAGALVRARELDRESCHRRAAERFSVGAMADAYLDVYRDSLR